MSDKFQVFLITCGLTVFNLLLIYWMRNLLELGQNGVEVPLIFGAIIAIGTIPMNLLCIISLLLPWSEKSKYDEDDYKRHKAKFKKSVGWRILKEVIDILD